MMHSRSPRRSGAFQQRWTVSRQSESESFLSQGEGETEVGESLFSTSAEFDDDDDYESSESRGWYGAVKKTLFQNTVKLLQGYDDWEEGSSDCSRLDEDSRTNTTQGDAVSSVGADSPKQDQPQEFRQSLVQCRALPALERDAGYLSFRRHRIPPLKCDVDASDQPIPLCRDPQIKSSSSRRRRHSSRKRSVSRSRSPSVSPRRSRIAPPTRSRSHGRRHSHEPRHQLQLGHHSHREYIEKVVISGDTDSTSEDALEFPNSPMMSKRAGDFSSPRIGRRQGSKRSTYDGTRARRAKLGNFSWEGHSHGQTGLVVENSVPKRERPSHRMDPLADAITPHSIVASQHTFPLADITTPHSMMVASKSFQTPRGRDLVLAQHHHLENFPRMPEDRMQSNAAFDGHFSAPEENEIVFNEEEINASHVVENLWEDGSAWRIENDDAGPSLEDQYEKLRTRTSASSNTLKRKEASAQDKLKNFLRRANCSGGAPGQILLESNASAGVSPLTEASEKYDSTDRLNYSLEDASQQDRPGFSKRDIGVLHHFKNARCGGQYAQFDESKLRAIVDLESSGRIEKSDTKEHEIADESERNARPEKQKKSPRNHKKKGFRGRQLVALGQRASCAAIPRVDSMKAETPRVPDGSYKRQTFDLDSSNPNSEIERPRPKLQENDSLKSQQHKHPSPKIDPNSNSYSPKFLDPVYGSNTGKVEWLVIPKEASTATNSTKKPDLPTDSPNVVVQDSGNLSSPKRSMSLSPDASKKYHTLYGDEVAEFRVKQQKSLELAERQKTNLGKLKVECSSADETENPAPQSPSPIKKVFRNVTKRFSPRKSARDKCTNLDFSSPGPILGANSPEEDLEHSLPVLVDRPLDQPQEVESNTKVDEMWAESPPMPDSSSSKPLVSALKKGPTRRQLKQVDSREVEMQHPNQGRSRRVMFSESVEEAFFEGIHRSETSTRTFDNDLWPGEEFVKALVACGRGSEDDNDVDSVSPTADLSEKQAVYNTPDDFQQFFSRNEHVTDPLQSPESVSKPLLPNEIDEVKKEGKRLENVLECPSERKDSLPKPNVGERFRLFRQKRAQKQLSREDAAPSDKGKRYKSLQGQPSASPQQTSNGPRAKLSISAMKRRQMADYKCLEGPSHSSTESGIIPGDEKNHAKVEETRKPQDIRKQQKLDGDKSVPKGSKQKKLDGDKPVPEGSTKKKKLRLKVFGKRPSNSVSNEAEQSKDNLVVHKTPEPKLQVKVPVEKKKVANALAKRQRRLTTSAKPVKTLTPIPEEDSTNGSLGDVAGRAPEAEIKTIRCKTKSTFRIKNLFRRKSRTEKQQAGVDSTLYVRRQRERVQRQAEEARRSKEIKKKESVESRLANRQVYGEVIYNDGHDAGHSSLPPVLIVEADCQKETKSSISCQDNKEETLLVAKVSPASTNKTEETLLRELEDSLSRQMMEDLLLLAKLEREQRRLAASGGKASLLSQKVVDSVVSRLEGKIAKSHRLRRRRNGSRGSYVRMADGFACTACPRM